MKITGEAKYSDIVAALDAHAKLHPDDRDDETVEIDVEIEEYSTHDKLVHLCDEPDEVVIEDPIEIEEADIQDAIECLAAGDRVTAGILFGRAFQSYPALSAAIDRALLSKGGADQPSLALAA